jgi:cytochrome c oxidase assembly protein subunit 15
MVLLWNAVVLHHRAGRPDGASRPVVSPELTSLGRLVLAAAGLVVLTGTVVTAAGPHAGDATARRLDVAVASVARVHGTSALLLVALTLCTLWVAHRDRAPAVVHDALRVLLAVLVAQAGVGYTQYFTGVPALLVGVHILGAVSVWIAAVRVGLTMREVPLPATAGPANVGDRGRRPALTAP